MKTTIQGRPRAIHGTRFAALLRVNAVAGDHNQFAESFDALSPLQPLSEGPLIPGPSLESRPAATAVAPKPKTRTRISYGDVEEYRRGNKRLAVQLARDPKVRAECSQEFRADFLADSSRAPWQSRKDTWEELALAAGFAEPFDLSIDLVTTVMGILKRAGYRSADAYLDVAFQIFVDRGFEPSSALLAFKRRSTRAARRNLGPAKQAQSLPLAKLGCLSAETPAAKGGPACPGRATRLASWWLFREIEAASAKVKHVVVNTEEKLVL